MATSLVAQLQRLAVPDTEPRKRPFIRPSILFDPKEAADIELDTLLNIALSGLEVLTSKEERFNKYKNDLFSYGSRELDRDLMGIEENKRINASIYSYLQLLSGYFELTAALKTLEYLIRRYKIHIYNIEELILCALPYHDTHVFVRVVQLIDTGNSKWKFLEGVKASGAPLPRNIIVQQSIRDLGILEVLCNYVTTSKKVQPSRPVTGFCTAVIFEVLGSLNTIDSEAVRRVLPFVEFGLQPGSRGGTDLKAGALMIVSLLADKVALSPKVVKSLIRSLAEVARADAKDSTDLQWCRLSLMTLITLVQLQSVEIIPKKIIDILKDIRDISGLLSELVEEFNTEKFLALFLDSLVEYSCYDDLCNGTLLSIVEMVPLKDFVARVISKLLNTSLRISKDNDSAAADAGSRCNLILVTLLKKYLFESREAVNRYIEDIKLRSKNDYEIVIRMLNCNLDLSHEISNSKLWFAMEHPKAEVRRSALLGLDVRGTLNVEAADFQKFGTIQDAILRRLCDEDLTVVQAALNLEELPEIISAPLRIDAFRNVLQRCIKILSSGASRSASLAVDIALSCLQHVAAGFPDEGEYVKMVATLVFPFIIIIPKTQRLNLKALEMAKQMKWPFYENLVSVSLLDKKLDSGKISSINAGNINALAKTLSVHPDEYLPWLVECCKTSELSKILFLLVLLQSFTLLETDGGFSSFFGICFPILRMEWELLESAGNISEEFNPGLWEGDIVGLIEHMVAANPKALNGDILTCLFWRLLGSFSKIAAEAEPLDENENWLCCFRDLFVFIVSHTNHVFKKHLCNVVAKCKIQTSHFLSEFFTDEGVSAALLIGSLHVFTSLSARPDESLTFQLFAEFPSILVPLSSDNQDVRIAAMNTIEGLLSLWSRVNLSRSKNGLHAVWVNFLGELLGLMVQQKRLLISDKNVLSSLFSSLLGNSNDSLLVQHNIGKRFDQTTKDEILAFLIGSALRFSAYAKLKILSLLKGVGDRVLRVNGVESLMLDLLDRRQKCHIGFDKSCHKLSQVEVDILCLLLEMCIKPSTTTVGDLDILGPILKALQVSNVSSGDPAVLKPCMTILGDLSNSFYASLETETQDLVFRHLVFLFRSTNGDIQKATREALLRINITCSILSRILEFICEQKVWSIGSRHEKKRKKGITCNNRDVCLDIIPGGGNVVAFVGSLLDVLLLKKDMENRASLICPLFKLLHNAFIDNEWIHVAANQDDLHYHASSENSQRISDAAVHIQQVLLLILEDITASVTSEDENSMNFDVELLIKCARSASNMVTRNQIFSLLSAISRAKPDKVLDHILEILVVIGESAVTQWDSNFQHIFEDLISAVVPCWLSKTDSADALLQIFVNILPEVSEHRRISMIVHVLRHLGESVSLGSLLYLLFCSLVARNCSSLCDRSDPSFSYSISLINTQWEYLFAVDLLEKYSCTVWLPSILMLLQRIVVSDSDATLFMELLVAMYFISNKLQNPEIAFKLDSGEDSDNIQLTVGAILKEIVCHLQLVDAKRKQIGVLSAFRKELKEYMNTALSVITKRLTPSVYFKVIVQLLGHVDKSVRRKALGTLSETVKDTGFVGLKHEKRGPAFSSRSSWFHLDENSLQSLDTVCLEILKLVNPQSESSSSLKLAAVSTLEVLANRFPSDNSVFSVCLDSVSKSICADNSALSSSCLRTAGALINVLGPKALPQLPFVMEGMIRQSRNALSTGTAETKQTDGDASIVSSVQNDSVFMSILLALEAVANKLGGFLNPYLGDILELMLLKPQYTSTSELKLKLKADSVRKLITERVPVRLLLSPLLRAYSDAILFGDSSVSIAFEMIQNLVAAMDRSSVGAYHVRIFDLCLQALDLRRQHPAAVRNIDAVEKNVINTVVALTMKLTEKMFKPLFTRSIEWSESIVEENENAGTKSIDRSIAFYGLVNSLAESHRSLFVPNFKHLLDGCVRHLMDAEDAESALNHKKKKVKLQESSSRKKDTDGGLSIGLWHLRALILSSLHKSFLYDTGTLKFLDSANFQVLLKPIVSQLVTDPPATLVQYPNVPSVGEVDDILVACVGQMAVTAGSDLLWKPLNHEVLMQTRSEKLRSRILGLRIVKYLVENLKEEYLVLLAETIPFLGELLEDVELPVKSLAQEILKEMESMSGESLRQYL
ncbi:uncharacterized protein At3g06530 isoform X3 [Lycium ferocissimum]|uniref:uncharacterized protein At3g06530 isoform X3 n=1 Tax=Lycium ferocissimum TaxID=112874 RepID=UPI0028169D3F|nr:uncharacterized protein At3g06530 isoform X3 [Lycium ferocissimum]